MKSEATDKRILDACCGSRMMWFDKTNPDVVFQDIREESAELCDGRTLEVKPDIVADFTNMPYADETFYLVVFDPPHLKDFAQGTWMIQKYGKLLPTWEDDIKRGFDECMRVLKPNGTLIFKWNEHQINLNQLLNVIKVRPLFGHTSGKHGKTKWMAFLKPNQ